MYLQDGNIARSSQVGEIGAAGVARRKERLTLRRADGCKSLGVALARPVAGQLDLLAAVAPVESNENTHNKIKPAIETEMEAKQQEQAQEQAQEEECLTHVSVVTRPAKSSMGQPMSIKRPMPSA